MQLNLILIEYKRLDIHPSAMHPNGKYIIPSILFVRNRHPFDFVLKNVINRIGFT